MRSWNKTHRLAAYCMAVLYVSIQTYLFVFWHLTLSSFAPIPTATGDIHQNGPVPQQQPTFSTQDTTTEYYSQQPPLDLERELEKGYDYAHSIQNVAPRHLKFVHIPKAAGSALEEAAGVQAQIDWGSCLFRHRPKRPGGVCRYPPEQMFEWPRGIGWWHLPPYLFPLVGSTDPYEDADLFVVVRNVSERLLSEYYYICWKNNKKRKKNTECDATRMHEPAYLNEWLTERLREKRGHLLSNTQDQRVSVQANVFLDHDGHFTPQYDFVVSPLGVRMVDYVLQMDRLEQEFPALMRAYGLDGSISLPIHKTNTMRNHNTTTTDPQLQVEHMNATVRELIQEVYRHDLELTG